MLGIAVRAWHTTHVYIDFYGFQVVSTSAPTLQSIEMLQLIHSVGSFFAIIMGSRKICFGL